VERDDSSLIGIVPMVRTVEPSFEAAKDAVLQHTPVAFTYRTASTGEVATRHVQPWAIASWHGHWYLTGFDKDKQAPRVFRLGRIEGEVATEGKPRSYEVPENHQPTTMISTVAVDRDPRPATLLVRVGAGHSLRRQATTVSPAGDMSPTGDTWSLIVVDYTDTGAFAAEICSFGPDVVVKGPAELRESVIRRLTGALGLAPASDLVNGGGATR
jgi:proteasome accessory factor B